MATRAGPLAAGPLVSTLIVMDTWLTSLDSHPPGGTSVPSVLPQQTNQSHRLKMTMTRSECGPLILQTLSVKGTFVPTAWFTTFQIGLLLLVNDCSWGSVTLRPSEDQGRVLRPFVPRRHLLRGVLRAEQDVPTRGGRGRQPHRLSQGHQSLSPVE